MREVTKLALSSLVLLAGLDPAVGNLAISPAVDVAPFHGAQHGRDASRAPEARARPGVTVVPHRTEHQRDHHRGDHAGR